MKYFSYFPEALPKIAKSEKNDRQHNNHAERGINRLNIYIYMTLRIPPR